MHGAFAFDHAWDSVIGSQRALQLRYPYVARRNDIRNFKACARCLLPSRLMRRQGVGESNNDNNNISKQPPYLLNWLVRGFLLCAMRRAGLHVRINLASHDYIITAIPRTCLALSSVLSFGEV